MRKVLVLLILTSSMVVKAQTALSVGFMQYLQRAPFGNSMTAIGNIPDKKWFVTSYAGISTSLNLFNGTGATFVAAPVGFQLNRRLNNNLFAFAGVSVAPSYINFNRSFVSSDINKYPNNDLFKANNFGAYAKAELGLMYVNDARTFSVSGSIGVERSTYPMIPYQQMQPSRVNPALASHK